MASAPTLPAFRAPYAADDRLLAADVLATRLKPEREARIGRTASGLVDAIRTSD